MEKDIIYFDKRQGTQADPLADITENLYVQYGKLFLKELPYEPYKVTVRNSNGTYMTEVYRDDDLNTTNTFLVDYRTGVLFFNGFNNGALKTVSYKGEGVILYPASRIYTNSGDDSDVVKTLQEYAGAVDHMVPKGDYSANTQYRKGNIVFMGDMSYMALSDVKGIAPPNATYWQAVFKGGLQGEQGERGDRGEKGERGDRGETGASLYTWIKFADTPTTGMSDSADGKDYIGIAANKTTEAKSSSYSEYTWTYIRGERGSQGIQGAKGEKGDPLYIWIMYADSPTAGMSDSPNGKNYIGIAANKNSAIKSDSYGDYTWSLVRGETGAKGERGAKGDKGDTGSLDNKWKGVYTNGTAYLDGDLVGYEGKVYIAKGNTTGNLPTNTAHWDLFVDKGADGKGAVESVNGYTGTISLTAGDVGAVASPAFNAHTADEVAHVTSSERSAWNSKASTSVATTSASGLMSATDKTKLSNIAANANNYVHPSSHPASMITESASHRFVTDTEKSTWNAKASTAVATVSTNGLMSSGDKAKLEGISANANNYTHPSSHPASMIEEDAANRFVSDAEKDTWNAKAGTAIATTTTNGLMSSSDKVKLGTVATNANNYVHPSTHPASIISQDTNNRFVTDAEKSVWNAKAGTAIATSASDGLLSSSDKTKLDGIAANANNYTHPSSHPATMITQSATHRFVTDTEKSTWNGKISASEKGVANGVARLNADGKVVDSRGNVIEVDVNRTIDGGGFV